MKTLGTRLKLIFATALPEGSLALFSGCGGGAAPFQAASNKTLGQELQDLPQSYEKGIITRKEYEDTKKRLVRNYTE